MISPMKMILLPLAILLILSMSFAEGTVQIFHKQMPPSLETLERVDSVLSLFMDEYQITYHLITDPDQAELISSLGLPDTHFPFAVVINGTYSAEIDGDTISFVHFPSFMHGIGRHQGNWSMESLSAVLSDNSLLLDRSVLPELEEDEEEEVCPGEEYYSLVDSILTDAVSYLGTPYVYGGTDENGFDCSGLAWRVFNDNGVQLPRTVSAMEEVGIPVNRDELVPGDILIFASPTHTGIYLGDGEFIHCSSYQDRGVVITPLSHSNYSRRYSGARRVIFPNTEE
ncbi:MAG: hypothetical protein GF388_07075 [Candidatus Aegiribacteria sp.]|nr:hypothetical protein [Candidatus Aegiribacteria sp.]MBD3294895.1 hypothetical protein [Candidatus Fermentibacteria bacterium]